MTKRNNAKKPRQGAFRFRGGGKRVGVTTHADLHKDYTYRGDSTGMPEGEVQARVAAARAAARAALGEAQ